MLNQTKRTILNGNQFGSMAPAKSLRNTAVKKLAKRLSSRDAFRALNGLLLRENALTSGRKHQRIA